MNDHPTALPTAPRQATTGRPLLFLHIPKTAGTSFLTLLHNLFGESRVQRLDGHDPLVLQQIDNLVLTRLGEVACVAGHIPAHHFHPYLKQFQPFTLLRNPVARVLSLFRFLRRASAAELQPMGLVPNFSFDSFITSKAPGLYAQTHDGMCRFLCGDARASDPKAAEFTGLADMPAVLEQAMRTLEGLDFGIVEQMAGSIALLGHAWGVPYPLDEYTKNATERGGSEDSLDNIRRIVQRNTLDIALYENATALFARRLAAWRAPVVQPRPGVVFAPTLGTLTNVAAIAGRQGFHDFERVGFAWMMADMPARIHFTPPAEARRLRLRLYTIGSDYRMADVVMKVNGQRAAQRVVERKDRWHLVELDLPPGLGTINQLAITSPYWVPTRFLNPDGRDDRSLALALSEVTFLG